MSPRPPSSSSEAFFSVGGTRLGSHTSSTTSAPVRYTSSPIRWFGEPARLPAAAPGIGSDRMSPAGTTRAPPYPAGAAAPRAAASASPPPAAFTAFVTSSLTTSSAVSRSPSSPHRDSISRTCRRACEAALGWTGRSR